MSCTMLFDAILAMESGRMDVGITVVEMLSGIPLFNSNIAILRSGLCSGQTAFEYLVPACDTTRFLH